MKCLRMCVSPFGEDDACSADMNFIAAANPSTLTALLDRLEAAEVQLTIYEKHGVTCQTFRHKLTGCAECNRDDAAESVNETNAVLAGNYFALLPKLEAAEVEVIEQARLLGISAEKELALMAKLEAAEKDAARYRYLFSGDKVYTHFRDAYDFWDGCGGKDGFDAVVDSAIRGDL